MMDVFRIKVVVGMDEEELLCELVIDNPIIVCCCALFDIVLNPIELLVLHMQSDNFWS